MFAAKQLLQDPSVLELMPTAVYIIDQSGLICGFNRRACEFWGRVPKLFDPDSRYCGAYQLLNSDGTPLPHGKTPMSAAVEEGLVFHNVEVVILRPDKTQITVSVNIVPLRDARGQVVGAINSFQDVTDLDMARRRIVEQRVQLEKAVAARDAFLSVCSHELKTPIASLKMQSQRAKRKLLKGDESVFSRAAIQEMIEHNDRQANRLNRLVDDMLDISRIETGKLEICRREADLVELVKEVATQCAQNLDGPAPELDVRSSQPIVGWFDPYRIEQVVANLLMNVAKYGMGQPAQIVIERVGEQARVSVADRGMGIAKEDQARIFERFERAVSEQNISGLGLGLYVSKEIVEAHSGTMGVESTLGSGSVFTVVLPLNGGAAVEEAGLA